MIREPINAECEFCDSGPSSDLVLVAEHEMDTESVRGVIWQPVYACMACFNEFKLRNDDVSLIELLKDIEI